MSATLETLFKGFTATIGNVTSNPKEDNRPEYVARKHGYILRCLHDWENPEPGDVSHYAQVWHRLRQDIIRPDMDYMRDPILTVLKGRIAELAVRHIKVMAEGVRREIAEDSRRGYSESALSFRMAARAFLDHFGELNDEHLQWIYLQLMAFMQFSYVKYMNNGYRLNPKYIEEEKETARTVWESRKLGDLWNYNKVHPFVTTLCPPSEIWDKYILDGKAHVVQADGSVTVHELSEVDFVKEPPKVKWLPPSGMC